MILSKIKILLCILEKASKKPNKINNCLLFTFFSFSADSIYSFFLIFLKNLVLTLVCILTAYITAPGYFNIFVLPKTLCFFYYTSHSL